MEEEIIDSPSKLCRVCFDNGDYELQKYELLVDNDKMNLKSMLKEFSVLETNDTDNIPSMLCKDCTNELIKCYEFVKKLRKADEQLQKILCENLYHDEQDEHNLMKKSTTRSENIINNENSNNHAKEDKFDDLNEYILDDSFSLSENDVNDDEEDDDDKHYIIEYENDEDNLNANIRIQLKNEENQQLNKIVKKGRKRKVNNNRTPHIIITDNVNNILSKVHKSSNPNVIEIEPSSSSASSIKLKGNLKNSKKFSKKSNQSNKDNEKSYKKFETISNEDRLVITKFVLTNDEIATTTTTSTNNQNNVNDDSNDSLIECLTTTATQSSINETTASETSTAINQIRMFDIAPVEIDATQQIQVNNFEDDIETNIENPNTMYKCKYCPKAFSTSHYLIKHARKSHCCQFCMKCFKKSEELYKHSREEHNQFKCTLCERDFSSNSNLRQHLKKIHNILLPAHTSILSFKKKE